jgi:hypothetical protein
MLGKLLSYSALSLLLLLSSSSGDSTPQKSQGAPEGFNPGPDIITGDIGQLGGLEQFGSAGTQVGLGVSTTGCNAGNVVVNFLALPATIHPVIPHNLYRMSGGPDNDERFEQIGQSWMKHAFGADQANTCFTCQTGGDFSHLGVGCSDTYANSQNADQFQLGSRAWINPFTGVFPSTANNHSNHTHTGTSHMLLVERDDLNTTLNGGATYYAEVQYLSSDEYAWCQAHPGQCNMYNNASYRQYNVSGTTSFNFSPVGNTVRMSAALNAWAAPINPIEPEPGVDGRAFIAWKVTNPSAGVWHYEYAIYNENLDRAIQSFSVPLGCGSTVSNLGFHAPPNHPGFPDDGTLGDAGFSNAAWTSNQTGNEVKWSTETFAQNQNANAIRWGTLYNFRFDSAHAPLLIPATIGFFKTGEPITVWIDGPNGCNATPSPTPTATASATASPPIHTPTPTATATASPPPATPTPSPTPTPSVTPSPVPTPILPPGGNGRIAYERNSNEIYVMDANGANKTNITNTQAQEDGPAWSPDGTKIAFASNRSGHFEIYVANANGSDPVRLTNNVEGNEDPSWSPDGTKIAFVSYRVAGAGIYVMNANGSNQTRLTNNPALEYQPAWSPDGGKIAFTSTRNGNTDPEIFLMDADGSNQINLTNHPGEDRYPAWSPDGTKIAFERFGAIFVMDVYGTNPTRLTNSTNSDFYPAWSPDGTKIVFVRILAPNNNPQIFVMDADGANQTNLSNDSNYYSAPAWQRIAAAPTPPAAQALNLSTRMRVQTGDNVGIGGFIITGSASKHVLLRAIGPSLTQFGIPNVLADPVMELHGPSPFVTVTNNNWQDDPAQRTAIVATGIPPANDLESAIDATLAPGAYTAIVSGNGNTSGVALVEIYDLDANANSKLGNISTRTFVSTGEDIVIAGFILGHQTGGDKVVVRGLGPSITCPGGCSSVLANPTLELRDSNGALLIANNDWQDNPAQAAEINAMGLAPASTLEAGLATTLPPGLYTALLAGVNNGTGLGLVEVYDLGSQ